METEKTAGLLELFKQFLAKQEKDLVVALKEQAEEVDSLIQKVRGLQEFCRRQFANQQTTQAGAGDTRCYSCGQLDHFAASCRRNAMHRQQRRAVGNQYVYPDHFHRSKHQRLGYRGGGQKLRSIECTFCQTRGHLKCACHFKKRLEMGSKEGAESNQGPRRGVSKTRLAVSGLQ